MGWSRSKIIICLLVLLPLIVSADETVVDEQKIDVAESIVPRDEIQRIANKTDDDVSGLRGRISGLESEIRKLRAEINSLRHRVSELESP